MIHLNQQFETVQSIENYELIPGGVKLFGRTEAHSLLTIEIIVYSNNLIRFKLYENKVDQQFPLVKPPEISQSAQLKEVTNGVVLYDNDLVCYIDFSPFEWRVETDKGKKIWRQQRNDINVRGSSNVPFLGISKSDSKISAIVDSYGLEPEERLYGFGEKFFAHDKRGHTLVSWNKDAYGVETERAYKNIPFFLSTQGYGILFHSTACIEHMVGDPDISRASYVFKVKDSELDFFIIYGPSLKKVLKTYHNLTGEPEIPPQWAFGLWMSRCYFHNRQTAEEVARKLRELDIPTDVLVFDGYWVRDAHQCDLLWDEERFPNPKEMLTGLREQGFKTCVWEGPFVPSGTEMFEEGERGGFLLVNPQGNTYLINTGLVMASHKQEDFKGQETVGSFDGLPPAPPAALVDFTNPEAVKWIQEKHFDLLNQGVDVFKTDFGEQVPIDAVSPHSGITGKRLHNLYAVLYNRSIFEATKHYHGKGLVWARSAGIGSQQYPVHWGGDPQTSYSSLAGSLRGGLSLGLSGIPFWGSDIGGFFGEKPSPRLYIRWAEMGLLSGVARCHGTTPREPWEYGEEALQIFRKYTKLRYQLIPYIYSSAISSAQTGLPLMKPFVLEWQDDQASQVVDSQYLLGDFIMVAPILSDQDERDVYFPQGDWLDYWTRNIYQGQKSIVYQAPLDILPLFIRRGAIIPMGPNISFIGENPIDLISLLVFPGLNSDFLFTDDQECTEISCTSTENFITIKVGASIKSYNIQIVGISIPKNVQINGSNIDQKQNPENLKPSWQWNGKELLITHCPPPPFEVGIQLNNS